MIYPLIAAVCVASLSVLGAITFIRARKQKTLHTTMLPIAVGVFLSVVFFELIPEAFHGGELAGSIAIAVGFMLFFLLSRLLYTYHHHHEDCCSDDHASRTVAQMVLFGDGVHNISDGIVIAIAFSVDPIVGVITTIGIALHEIPQEIAEFAILLEAGYSKKKAAFLNFLSASSITLGAALTLVFLEFFAESLGILLGLAAGNLLYIAAADLLPRLHAKDNENGSFWHTFSLATTGLVIMSLILVWSHENIGHVEMHDEHVHQEDVHDHEEKH